jgi:hypothetical protein
MRVRSAAPAPAAPPTSNPKPSGPRRPASFTAVLGERIGNRSGAAPPPAPPPTPKPPGIREPAAAGGPPAASSVRALLERTVDADRRVDTLLAAAARGKTFSPAELLALQATVFRYSQAVEVVSRATDKLVGAVKQTMATQV